MVRVATKKKPKPTLHFKGKRLVPKGYGPQIAGASPP
jgi:hypothetical protein